MGNCTSSGGGGGGTGARGGAPKLDSNLIRRANEAGIAVDNGDIVLRHYNENVQTIRDSALSDSDKQEAINKLHELTTKQLREEADTVNPYATGRGVGRFDRQQVRTTGDRVLDARRDVREYMDDVRKRSHETALKNHQKAMTTAMNNALQNGSLTFTVNGITYRRKSKRAKAFERVYET